MFVMSSLIPIGAVGEGGGGGDGNSRPFKLYTGFTASCLIGTVSGRVRFSNLLPRIDRPTGDKCHSLLSAEYLFPTRGCHKSSSGDFVIEDGAAYVSSVCHPRP